MRKRGKKLLRKRKKKDAPVRLKKDGKIAYPTAFRKKEGKEHAPDFYTGYVDDDTLVTKLDRAGVKFQSEIPDTIGQLFFEMFVTVILPLLLMVWLFTYMMKRMNKGGGMMGIEKSNAKMYMEKETGVTFRDVAGEDEAKESLQEVVDFLHNPGKYSGIGAKLPS